MKTKYFFFLFFFLVLLFPISVQATTKGTKTEKVTLSQCVDGNSARFMSGVVEVKIRFLSIRLPQSVHPTKEAEELTEEINRSVCETLTNAKTIELEYDPENSEEDSIGRRYAWVFVDGKLLQLSLVEQGYAEIEEMHHAKLYQTDLNNALTTAKEEKVGVWGIDREEKNIEAIDLKYKEEIVEEKGFFRAIIDKILNFLNEIFEKFLKMIDNLIEDML